MPSLIAHAQDEEDSSICSISLNSHWGILSIGTTNGLIVIDYLQNKKIFAMSTGDIMRYSHENDRSFRKVVATLNRNVATDRNVVTAKSGDKISIPVG